MSLRFLAAVSALAIACTVSSLAQTPKRAATASTAKKWTPPRTPWGDPDLQGSFSNLSEEGTPLEKPPQFEGRRLEDIKGPELAAIKQAMQKRTIETFQGPLHAPEHFWQDDLNLVKGSQA